MAVPEMPLWMEVVLACASVMVVALTGLVSVVTWAAPRLRDVSLRAGSKSHAAFFAMLEAGAHALGQVLQVLCSFIPRLKLGAPMKLKECVSCPPTKHSADSRCGTAAACDKVDCPAPAKPRNDDNDDDDGNDDDDPGAPGGALISVRDSFPGPKPSVPA